MAAAMPEHAHEGIGGLLVARGHRTPLFEPGPKPLDLVAVGVDPVWAGHGRLVLLGRDRGPGAQVPDVLAKAMAAVAAVGDDPAGHAWQLVEQRHGMRQLVRLAWCEDKGHGPAYRVGDHASLGAIAAARAAKRFTMVPLC